MKLMLRVVVILFNPLALILMINSPVLAGQYSHCYPVKEYRTIRDSANHPNAYDDGYREGAASARRGESYKPRTTGGEFARGFEEGYYGRPYTGQQNTVPNRQEEYITQKCRTYYYNDKDSIDTILNNVLDNFERDMIQAWNLQTN